MCGIIGEVFFKGNGGNTEWVRQGCQIMAHRGPDGDGLYHDSEGGVVLGHRRLSIIDLAGGAQPMSYADGRYWITFNGEIYNYRELKAELSALGCSFASSSDTEVIMAAYATWGIDSFCRMDGIFAFAIWDRATRMLVIARDHLGVKPLLYHADANGVRFASELKTLVKHPQVQPTIDPCALQDYLSLGYVLSPRTLIQGVSKLPAGNCLIVCDGRVEQRSFWNLADFAQQRSTQNRSEADYFDQFDAFLGAAVQAQMVSDVPLGAFLSGGIDSSSIVYYARQNGFKTFSIGFNEPSYSELDFAQQAAQHLGSDHSQQIVAPPSLDDLSQLAWYYDEPIGDTSVVPTYFVSKLARQHVTVSLSGDGGDELLAGYDTYIADRFQTIYSRIPRWLHQGIVQPAANMIPSSYRKVSTDFKIKQFVAHAYDTPEAAHYGWRGMFNPEERKMLGMSQSQSQTTYSPFETYQAHYRDVPDATPLNRSLYVDIKTWLVDDILTKVDRASMACSLESRVPFLSPRFVEFAMTLPANLKLRGMKRKYILKQTMKDRLPQTLIDRKKRGFNSPVGPWLRDVLRPEIDSLFRARSSTIIDLGSPALQAMWQDHCSGRVDHGYKLWTLLNLVLWEQRVYAENK